MTLINDDKIIMLTVQWFLVVTIYKPLKWLKKHMTKNTAAEIISV